MHLKNLPKKKNEIKLLKKYLLFLLTVAVNHVEIIIPLALDLQKRNISE